MKSLLVYILLNDHCSRYWDLKTGQATVIEGKGHTNQVTKMRCQGDTLVTCGIDDTVRYVSIPEKKYK